MLSEVYWGWSTRTKAWTHAPLIAILTSSKGRVEDSSLGMWGRSLDPSLGPNSHRSVPPGVGEDPPGRVGLGVRDKVRVIDVVSPSLHDQGTVSPSREG